jgi:hypothetical protein
MKQVGLLLTLGIALLSGCAAQRYAEPEMMRHEARVTYDNVSDDALFTRIREWIVANFNWNGEILRHANPETRTLMARGRWVRATSYAPMAEADIDYTLSVEINKGEVFYSLSRLVARTPDDGEELTFFSTSEKFHVDAEERFQAVLVPLNEALRSGK